LKRVDADVLDRLIVKEDAGKHSLSEDEIKKLRDIFDKAINNPNMKVEIENQSAEAMPVMITMEEWMRRMKDMSKLGGGMNFYGSMPDSYKVSVNANHKLISKYYRQTKGSRLKWPNRLLILPCWRRGYAKGADLTAFVERSVETM
jgi:molecular chaperone HtpG